jgi:hypothetical protein
MRDDVVEFPISAGQHGSWVRAQIYPALLPAGVHLALLVRRPLCGAIYRESAARLVISFSKSPGDSLTYSLGFVGGFGDAAGFVLAKARLLHRRAQAELLGLRSGGLAIDLHCRGAG